MTIEEIKKALNAGKSIYYNDDDYRFGYGAEIGIDGEGRLYMNNRWKTYCYYIENHDSSLKIDESLITIG